MRRALNWTAALSLAWLIGCGDGSGALPDETAAAGSIERDLTLASAAAAPVEVASPVELGRSEPPKPAAPRRRASPRQAAAPSPRPPRPEAVAVPEPVAVAVEASGAAPAQPQPAADSRELLPGQTVAVIPAAAGPSPAGPDDLGLPAEPARGMFKPGAGNCPHPPRGIRGGPVGIARLPLSPRW